MTSKIEANGIFINYRLEGNKNSPVVMLSNSLLSNYSMWDDQIDALLQAGFQVLRHDTRGHGGTDAPSGPYSIELLVEDVRALLDALEINKVHFVGLSMGGFIAQLLAVTHPERVISLGLCDTACVMPPALLWNERIDTAKAEGVQGSLTDATLKRWFTAPFHETGKHAIEKIRVMIKQTSAQGYINNAMAIRDMDLCKNLPNIKVPTLVIVGAEDPACPVSAAQILHEGISGAELVILEGAAHLPNIEKRDEFNAALLNFLKRHR